MANLWFKFYGAEYLSDPKMDRLTVQERSCWLTILCMASQTNGIIKYISVEGLLNKSGIRFNPYDTTEWDNALKVLKTFEQYEMIMIHKDGVVEVKNWEKRQEHNLTVAERVAKSREKKKNVTSDVTNVTTEENRIEENRIDKHISSLFEKFWSMYPKKIGKGDVEKKFSKLPKETQALIIEHLEKRIGNDDQWDKGYIPNPSTFLNQRRWEDEWKQKEEQTSHLKIS